MPSVVVKLGGAIITHKRSSERRARPEVIRVLARAVAEVHSRHTRGRVGHSHGTAAGQEGRDRLVVLHGAGCFGHREAAAGGVHRGGGGPSAAAATRAAVVQLNGLVVAALVAEGVPAVGVSPFAVARAEDGRLSADGAAAVREAVCGACARGLVPVLHGDVVMNSGEGGPWTVVSGDDLLLPAARATGARRVVCVTDVDGVLTADPAQDPGARLVPAIEVDEEGAASARRRADATEATRDDVTGGMAAKHAAASALVLALPGAEVVVVSGHRPDEVRAALDEARTPAVGTVVRLAGAFTTMSGCARTPGSR